MRCTATVKPEFKSASGALLTGAKSYQFNGGGPFVQGVRPNTYQQLDEEQFFVLQLNGPATTESVQANVWCALEGVGERVPVRMIEGAQRTDLLKALGLEKRAAKEPLQFPSFACNRRLTSGSQLQLVFGKAWPRPAGWPTAWKSASPTGCAKRLRPNSAASVKTPRRPACRCARCRCRSTPRCRASWPWPSGSSRLTKPSSPGWMAARTAAMLMP